MVSRVVDTVDKVFAGYMIVKIRATAATVTVAAAVLLAVAVINFIVTAVRRDNSTQFFGDVVVFRGVAVAVHVVKIIVAVVTTTTIGAVVGGRRTIVVGECVGLCCVAILMDASVVGDATTYISVRVTIVVVLDREISVAIISAKLTVYILVRRGIAWFRRNNNRKIKLIDVRRWSGGCRT